MQHHRRGVRRLAQPDPGQIESWAARAQRRRPAVHASRQQSVPQLSATQGDPRRQGSLSGARRIGNWRIGIRDALSTLDALLQNAAATPQLYPPNSRYYGQPTLTLTRPDGTTVAYLSQRYVPQPDDSAGSGRR